MNAWRNSFNRNRDKKDDFHKRLADIYDDLALRNGFVLESLDYIDHPQKSELEVMK
jgi:hypothetical protein